MKVMPLAHPALLCAALLAGCLGSIFETAAGGSGTEGENGSAVAGIVCYPDGRQASGVAVFLRSSDYLRDTSLGTTGSPPDAITDSSGAYRLPVRFRGRLSLVFRDGRGMAALRIIEANRSGAEAKTPDTLLPVGSLAGTLGRPEGHSGRAYVQVFGLDILVRADSSGGFLVPDLPRGAHRIRAVSPWPKWSYAPSDTIRVAPLDTARLPRLVPVGFAGEDYSLWPFSRRIRVNTAAAGIAGTVEDFPLFVRLDSSRFDFQGSSGRDIRFSNAAGKRLPFQREEWDGEGKVATVWVRLDTVQGNDSSQFITLHWGNPDAADFSDGKEVFSTFSGAWHFSDSISGSGDGISSDASPFQHDGVARLVPGRQEGIAGGSAVFDHRRNTSIQSPAGAALMPARNLTVSAWFRIAETGTWGSVLATQGDNYLIGVDETGRANFSIYTDSAHSPNHDPRVNPWNVCKASGPDLRDGGWHHAAGTYDGARMRVFVDGGAYQGVCDAGKPITYIFGGDFRMGMHGVGSANFEFSGNLDEVQVSGTTRSPDWIRLAFESQRPDSRLLDFSKP